MACAGKTRSLVPMTSLTTSDLLWAMFDLSLRFACCCDSESIGKTCVLFKMFFGDVRLRRHVNSVSSSELMDAWQDKEKRHLT